MSSRVDLESRTKPGAYCASDLQEDWRGRGEEERKEAVWKVREKERNKAERKKRGDSGTMTGKMEGDGLDVRSIGYVREER